MSRHGFRSAQAEAFCAFFDWLDDAPGARVALIEGERRSGKTYLALRLGLKLARLWPETQVRLVGTHRGDTIRVARQAVADEGAIVRDRRHHGRFELQNGSALSIPDLVGQRRGSADVAVLCHADQLPARAFTQAMYSIRGGRGLCVVAADARSESPEDWVGNLKRAIASGTIPGRAFALGSADVRQHPSAPSTALVAVGA